MKYRSIIAGVALLCFALVLAWFFWLSAQPTSPTTRSPDTARTVVAPPPTPITGEVPPREEQQRTETERADTIRSAIEGTNAPINFLGRVVDQSRREAIRAGRSISELRGRYLPM